MKREIVSAVVAAALFQCAAFAQDARVIVQQFNTSPFAGGWCASGQTNLFAWDPFQENLQVTWDSRLQNSYFYFPVGYELNKHDSFAVEFDLRLDEIIPGIDPAKNLAPFQLALGFVRIADATAPWFVRGTGTDSPNIVLFEFYPDPGGSWIYGPSLIITIYNTNSTQYSGGGFYPDALQTNTQYRIRLHYDGQQQMLNADIHRNGELWIQMPPATLRTNFTDFRIDAFAICNFSDAGQWPGWEGSIYARGLVDNVVLTLPPPPVEKIDGRFTDSGWQVTFQSRTNWLYALERSSDLSSWATVLEGVPGTGQTMTLTDPSPADQHAFYRVRACKP